MLVRTTVEVGRFANYFFIYINVLSSAAVFSMAKIRRRWYSAPVPPRCRVTFFDTVHQIQRSLEVDVALPFAAAEVALHKLAAQHILLEDLAPTIKVEVISTTEITLAMAAITMRGSVAKAA
jgi:hypothetical protein